MEFDVGTILYIVITIIVVIAGALGKKKKPSANSPKVKRESGFEGFFNKLGAQFEEIKETQKSADASWDDEIQAEGDVETEQAPATTYEETEANKGFESIFDAYEGEYDPDAIHNQEMLDDEGVRTTEDNRVLKVIELQQEDKVDFNEFLAEFDLRKAVIYSIIIDKVEY